MSKTSKPRPYSVSLDTFDNNWLATFKKPDPRIVEDQINEDEAFNNIEEKNTENNKDK